MSEGWVDDNHKDARSPPIISHSIQPSIKQESHLFVASWGCAISHDVDAGTCENGSGQDMDDLSRIQE